MTTEEAIQIHGADAVFTASSAGACEDYGPLRALGLHVDSIEAADHIGTVVYRSMSAEEKVALHWDDMDFRVDPRMHDESEAAYLYGQSLMELIQQQVKKRCSCLVAKHPHSHKQPLHSPTQPV